MSRLRRPLSARSTTGSWNTTLLACRAASGSVATSNPASRALPPVGTIVVVSIPIVVDLPAPFGPDEAEHLAALDLEVDALHGLDPSRVGLLRAGAPRWPRPAGVIALI